MENKLLLSYSL